MWRFPNYVHRDLEPHSKQIGRVLTRSLFKSNNSWTVFRKKVQFTLEYTHKKCKQVSKPTIHDVDYANSISIPGESIPCVHSMVKSAIKRCMNINYMFPWRCDCVSFVTPKVEVDGLPQDWFNWAEQCFPNISYEYNSFFIDPRVAQQTAIVASNRTSSSPKARHRQRWIEDSRQLSTRWSIVGWES